MSDSREQNLRLLSIFNYIVGGMTMLFSLFPVFHLIMGLTMLFIPDFFESGGSGEEIGTRVMGGIFTGFALMIMIPGEILGFLMIRSGQKIARRKGYQFSFVIACVQCLCMPLGTILGVFTIVLLNRDEYKALYGGTIEEIIE